MTRNLVMFMDRGLIILNKPAGLIAQGGRHLLEPKTETLECVLEDLTNSLSLKTKPLPVHRLDKLTTGILILARNPQIAQTLSTQLRQSASNDIIKTYLALVHGSFEPSHAGEIRENLYITNGKVSVKKPVATNFKETTSYTTWRCLASRGDVSLMELGLRTGIKHQLRVTMAQVLNAPIVGDPIYGSIHSQDEPHLMLHSARVEILRYLRKPVLGTRTYRLGLTVPPPSGFLGMCQNSGLTVGHEWTYYSPVCVTINGSEISYDNRLPLGEEVVVNALRKLHTGK